MEDRPGKGRPNPVQTQSKSGGKWVGFGPWGLELWPIWVGFEDGEGMESGARAHGGKMFSGGWSLGVVCHKCSGELELSAGARRAGACFGKMGKYLSVPFRYFPVPGRYLSVPICLGRAISG